MIVHDIVQVVSPDAKTSTPAGRWIVATRDDEQIACTLARTCQEYAAVPGIVYYVERHIEDCPGRATDPRDLREDLIVPSGCRCQDVQDRPGTISGGSVDGRDVGGRRTA
jgi:hypothetical protein